MSDSVWTFYNSKGKIKNLITYVDDKKNGCAKFYDSLGNVTKELFYIENVLQNELIEYYIDGSIKSVTNFINGKEIGQAFEYSNNGYIITELIYDDGFLKSKKEINRFDSNNLKTGYWREFYTNGKLKSESNYEKGIKKGITKNYNLKGKIESIKIFTNDTLSNGKDIELIKLYKSYHDNSYNEKLVGGFYDNMKQGIFREYNFKGDIVNGYIYKNDTIIAQGLILNNGSYDGDWKTFYASGNIKSEGTYSNGAKNGLWVFYFENGKIQQKGKYKNEIPSGEWKWYYENGSLKRIEFYRKGKLEGNQIEYNINGKEITNGEFYNGLKEGPWFYHVADFKEVGEFTMGYKTGNWIYYFKSGKIAFKGAFDEGQPKGKHIYYFENGTKKLKGKFIAGDKHGVWKKYNLTGELIEYIKYNRGEVVAVNGVKIKPILNE